MADFATTDELQAYWRPLSDAEKTRAEALLSMASNRLRVIAKKSGVDLEALATDEAYASNLKWVVLEATKRALITPIDQPAVTQYQQTAGPYSENYRYANPTGDLWFKKVELDELGLSGRQHMVSLSTSRTDIYGS